MSSASRRKKPDAVLNNVLSAHWQAIVGCITGAVVVALFMHGLRTGEWAPPFVWVGQAILETVVFVKHVLTVVLIYPVVNGLWVTAIAASCFWGKTGRFGSTTVLLWGAVAVSSLIHVLLGGDSAVMSNVSMNIGASGLVVSLSWITRNALNEQSTLMEPTAPLLILSSAFFLGGIFSHYVF